MAPFRPARTALALLALAGAADAVAQGGAAPSRPGDLRVERYSSTAAELFWSRSTDPDGFVRGYEIRRDGTLLRTSDGLSHFTDALVPGRATTFSVTAVDFDGLRSAPASVSVTTGNGRPSDANRPPPPANLRASVYSRTAAELFWDRGVPGRRYEVRRDGSAVRTTDGTSHFVGDLVPGTSTVFDVVAIDAAGARSGAASTVVDTGRGGAGSQTPQNPQTPTPPAAAGPAAPRDGRITVYSSTAAELFWRAYPAPDRVRETIVTRDGVEVGRTRGTSFFDPTRAPGQRYRYELVAVSADGARSAPARVEEGGAAPTAPPAGPPASPPATSAVPAPAEARLDVYSRTAAELFWRRPPASARVAETIVSRDGTEIGRTPGTSFFDGARADGREYRYELVALDRDGRRSAATVVGASSGPARPTPPAPRPPEPAPPVQPPQPVPPTPAPAADLLPAAAFPTLNADGSVAWPFAPVDGALGFDVTPWVTLPVARSGRTARINDLFTGGGRTFVLTEQDGLIYDITDRSPTLWFDVAAAIRSTQGRSLDTRNLFHGGLRSAAFHPDFATNGKLYTTLMEERPTDRSAHTYLSDLEGGIDADSVLVEWTADPATMTVDPSSYREVFRVGVPEYDHPIKQAEFDPYARRGDADHGLLYVGHGDGSVASSTARGGQRNDALGKVLRVNPLRAGDRPFTIPASNPFVGDASMLDAVYSLGHRNPHWLTFAPDGRLIVAEAGRDNVEEVNLIRAGGNYGWSDREGAYVQLAPGTIFDGIRALPANDATRGFVYPSAQLGHVGRPGQSFVVVALAGGPVIERGGESLYLYNEFASTGEIFYSRVRDLEAATVTGSPAGLTVARTFRAAVALDADGDPATAAIPFPNLQGIIASASGYDGSGRADTRLGQDAAGNVYVLNKRNNVVYRATARSR